MSARYTGTHEPIDAARRVRMRGSSWCERCPTGLDELHLLRIRYWGFDRTTKTGELVVGREHADALVDVFGEIFAAGFPIQRIAPIDEFQGDDEASMTANNSSAFNCRRILGTERWSEHAYGTAVDINPVQNPYVARDGSVHPAQARPFLDRSLDEPGMIHAEGPVVRAFAAIGWSWGGHWTGTKDYQHFSHTGR